MLNSSGGLPSRYILFHHSACSTNAALSLNHAQIPRPYSYHMCFLLFPCQDHIICVSSCSHAKNFALSWQILFNTEPTSNVSDIKIHMYLHLSFHTYREEFHSFLKKHVADFLITLSRSQLWLKANCFSEFRDWLAGKLLCEEESQHVKYELATCPCM